MIEEIPRGDRRPGRPADPRPPQTQEGAMTSSVRRLRHERPAPAGPGRCRQQMDGRAGELAETEVDGTVADGLVTVTVNGTGELVRVKIRGRLLRPRRHRGPRGPDRRGLPRRHAPRPTRSRPRSSVRSPSGLGAAGRWRRRRQSAGCRWASDVRRHRPGPHRRARSAARGGPEERAAHRLPPARRPTRPTYAGSPRCWSRSRTRCGSARSAATSPRRRPAGSAATRVATRP